MSNKVSYNSDVVAYGFGALLVIKRNVNLTNSSRKDLYDLLSTNLISLLFLFRERRSFRKHLPNGFFTVYNKLRRLRICYLYVGEL